MGETHYDLKTKMLGGFPKIKKLGAVSPNGESTPFVWNNRFMRLELDDATNGVDFDYKTSAVIRDRETGKIISRFGEGCYYFSFYQENGTAYVLGTKSENGMLCGNTIMLSNPSDMVGCETTNIINSDIPDCIDVIHEDYSNLYEDYRYFVDLTGNTEFCKNHCCVSVE